jgi:hypothetical protein
MVRKHVHATVLTVLHRIAHDSTVPLGQREPSVAPKKGLPRAD